MKIALGSDHAGYEVKEKLKTILSSLGHEWIDKGTGSAESCDYPDFAAAVAKSVAGGEAESGILICGAGIGMSMAANKVPGIRAAKVCSEEEARLSRQHNNANVLCLGARTQDYETRIVPIVKTWLTASFEGGRHAQRVDKITNIEKEPRA